MKIIPKKKFGDQYIRLLIFQFFAAIKRFPPEFLDQCKNNPNEIQFLTYEFKVAYQNGYGIWVICTSGDDMPKWVIE